MNIQVSNFKVFWGRDGFSKPCFIQIVDLRLEMEYLRTKGDKMSFLKYISKKCNYTKVKGLKL